jgi:ATP-dependent Lhr-like helicase
MSGEIAWGRFWGASHSPVRRTPVALVPRADLDVWTALAASTVRPAPLATAEEVLAVLRARGAVFVQEIARVSRLPLASVELGLGALVAQGRLTCDSFGGLRWLLLPGWRRRSAGLSSGRWSRLGAADVPGGAPGASGGGGAVASTHAEFVARRLLRRTGIVFRRTASRERIPVPWRDVARACRTLEARGEVRGGRFVAGFDGEQYALPGAVSLLRSVRRKPERPPGPAPFVRSPADPLNYTGILTPGERVPGSAAFDVRVS